MSLARGLDYYTGIIYEAITSASAPPSLAANPSVPPSDTVTASSGKSKKSKDAKTEDGPDESTVGVGSIAGGGRYDNLVGMFAEAAGQGKKDPVPCVGMSVGVERIYSLMAMRMKQNSETTRGKETEVFIMNFGKEGLLKERMALAKKLRDAGIKVRRSINPVGDRLLIVGRVHVQREPEGSGAVRPGRFGSNPLRCHSCSERIGSWNRPHQAPSR